MIQKAQYQNTEFNKILEFNILDFRNIIEEIPRPVLLIKGNNGQVVSANHLFSELMQIGIVEISGLNIAELIPSIDLANLNDGDKKNITIILKDDQTLDAHLEIRFINQTDSLLLLLFNEEGNGEKKIRNSWEEFSKAQSAILEQVYEISFDALLNEILIIGKQITNSDEAIFYISQEGNPTLKRYPASSSYFPDQIPALEINRIKEIDFWEPGKRVLSEIHRVGRLNKFGSIITIPIPSGNQPFGLIIAAIKNQGDTNALQDILEQYRLWVSTTIELFKGIQKESNDFLNLGAKVEKLELFFNNSTDCLLLLNWKNQILEFNSNFLDLLDYLPVELLGKDVKIIFDNSPLMTLLMESGVTKNDRAHVPLEIYDRHGMKKYIYAKVINSGIGIESRKLVIIKDTSELKSIENTLLIFKKNAALGEILAEFTHDVRNIINRITTGLQLLVKKINPENSMLTSFQELQNGCIEMADLMESVLSFSRQNYEKFQSENIKAMAERIFYRLQKKATQANVSLILNPKNGEFLAWVDQRSLERVITNLINNGIEAIGSKGGAVSISLSDSEEHAGCLLIQIADTGPGIPTDIQSTLYQKFSSGKAEGTGLGLFISQKIIEYHKGWIDLETFPGGTIFNIHIPKENRGDPQ